MDLREGLHIQMRKINYERFKEKMTVESSVVEPELEPPFLAGAGVVKKGAAPAPALQLKLQL